MALSYSDLKKLHQKKYRAELGYFLVEGEHLVLELEKAALKNPALIASTLYVTESHKDFVSALPKQIISEKNMALIADTATPQGIIAVAPLLPAASTQNKSERAIYLHEVQDPGNLGSILRTLAWFGNCRCLLSPGSVDPYNPKVVRASMGAIFHVPIELDVALDSLPSRFEKIAVMDMHGSALSSSESPNLRSHDCFLFGNEARGIPREHLHSMNAKAFCIPGCGAIESLNLASAVNICVYELNR